MPDFQVLGEITGIETMAEGKGIRELARLVRTYGVSHWRKRKGMATVELAGGRIRKVELHWYEAHGVGRTELKIKLYLD